MGNIKVQELLSLEECAAGQETRKLERWHAACLSPIEKNSDFKPQSSNIPCTAGISDVTESISNEQNLFNISNSSSADFPRLDINTISKNNIKQSEKTLGYEIALAIQRNEQILKDISSIILKNIDIENQAILNISKEDEKNLNELLKKLTLKENTDIVKSMLNVVVSSSAIVAGTLVLSAPVLAGTSALGGYALAGSGIANLLINEILPRVGGYEKIANFFTSDTSKTQSLADNIQIVSSISNTVLQLATSFATASIISSVFETSKLWNLLDTGIGIASSLTTFANHYTQGSYKASESKQTSIDGSLKLEQFKLNKSFSNFQSATDIEEAFNKLSYNIFQTIQKMGENNTNKGR
jgi:hypothetical protein